MKYRWTTQIMTRDSGMLVVYCKDQKQAEGNVTRFANNRIQGNKVISFENISNTANVMLLEEIISLSVGDQELFHDIHKEEALCCKRLHEEIDFSTDDKEDSDRYE